MNEHERRWKAQTSKRRQGKRVDRGALENAVGHYSAALQGSLEVLQTEARLLLEAAGERNLVELDRRRDTVSASCEAIEATAVSLRNLITYLETGPLAL